MRSIDWGRTAVGPVEHWPQSLRTALSILLETGVYDDGDGGSVDDGFDEGAGEQAHHQTDRQCSE